MNVSEVLSEAIDNGDSLNVIYHGGSQAGKSRVITPISVIEEKVRARCHTSNAVKTFLISKMELLNKNSEIKPTWDANHETKQQFYTIVQLHQFALNTLQSQGWCIHLSDDRLSVHRKFKTGRVVKSPEVELYYEEFSYDLVLMDNGSFERTNVRPRSRPWGVRAKKFNTKTFGKLDSAAKIFFELADERSA